MYLRVGIGNVLRAEIYRAVSRGVRLRDPMRLLPPRSALSLGDPPWLLLTLQTLLLLCGALSACGKADQMDTIRKDTVYGAEIPVETLRVVPRGYDEQFLAAGVIEARDEATVSAELQGRIESLHYEIGDSVRRGARLVTLDSRAQAATVTRLEAEVARARTQVEWAGRDLERQRRLFETKVSAERARDDAQRQLDTAEDDLAARLADLELARVELSRTEVTSPLSGRIARRFVSAGEYVNPGTQLFEIVATDRVKFVFSVAERDVITLEPGQELEVQVDAHRGALARGKISAISPAGAEGTRTYRVELALNNDPELALLPGMAGRATVVRRSWTDVWLIPESAILRDDRKSYIYVVDGTGESPVARRLDVQIVSQSGTDAVIAPDSVRELEVLILGQAAVVEGTEIRIRRLHETAPREVFD